MRRNVVFFTAALFAVTLVVRVWAQPGKPAAAFQGYWMGVDPVDGGDARRSFVLKPTGRLLWPRVILRSRSATAPIAGSAASMTARSWAAM